MATKNSVKNIMNQHIQEPATVIMIEPVAAYVRVSTQEQKLHGISLDAQKAKIQKYAEEHNMRIVEWYLDEGVSGRKLIKNRPELQRMVKDAPSGRFKRILFIKLDRFFRSVAEYHECMKKIAPVIWTATEENYDLSTANGRLLVNMKLTIAEMEADQTGERIRIVNDYKVRTGQPLVGNPSLPFGFMVGKSETAARKTVVKDPDKAPVLMDILQYLMTHQSRRGTIIYLRSKYQIQMSYPTLTKLMQNTMLYGAYRDNPSYCEAYIDKATFDKLQGILQRNVKKNTAGNKAYYFSGLLTCPVCGCRLKGGSYVTKKENSTFHYKKYRCANHKLNCKCTFNKVVSENTLEKLLLADIENFLEDAKIRSAIVSDGGAASIPKYDIESIHDEIDRLNYSWQTGKIRKVEQYEKQYLELTNRLEEAKKIQHEAVSKDFSKIDDILRDGWKTIYENLDDVHKRAFWRSFIKSIEIHWTTERKEIARVNFI